MVHFIQYLNGQKPTATNIGNSREPKKLPPTWKEQTDIASMKGKVPLIAPTSESVLLGKGLNGGTKVPALQTCFRRMIY